MQIGLVESQVGSAAERRPRLVRFRAARPWDRAQGLIGIALFEKFPDVDPLTVRFTDLRERVLTLDAFDDDPKGSNEPKLEAIQMAWYEERKDS